MATFRNEKVIESSIEAVFEVFFIIAKRDFKDFDVKNPTLSSAIRKVGTYSLKESKLLVKITDFKKNEVYEITSSTETNTYVTRYELISLSPNSTKIVLIEKDISVGAVNLINTFIAMIFFKGRVKKRFNYLMEGFLKEIEQNKK